MEESPECNTRVDEAHQLLPPMWWTEEVLAKEANWSQPMGEAGTIPIEGEDLE